MGIFYGVNLLKKMKTKKKSSMIIENQSQQQKIRKA
jgi:hypothetical protein